MIRLADHADTTVPGDKQMPGAAHGRPRHARAWL